MNQPWRIQLLGGLRAQQGERLITRFRSQRTALLLAYLAYHRYRSHPREVLIELLWPDSTPEAARHNLSQALSSLRHQLEPPGVPAGAVILADRATVELNPEACTTDVAEFEAALRGAIQARHTPDFAMRLEEAVELYGGPLLLGYYEDWVVTEQDRLRERYAEAVLQLVPLLEQGGEWDRALVTARQAVSADPMREGAHQALIRILLASGQPEAALRQYRELESLLQEELATTPSAASRQLLRQIEGQWLGLSDAPGSSVPGKGAPSQEPRPSAPPTTAAPAASPGFPTGTVTFLLTDIEGSTALWEQFGDAFKPVLKAHHDTLRGAFRRYGGCEVKEAGDSFLVAFGAASDALDCAVACQKALASTESGGASADLAADQLDAPNHPPIRVRMALQSGDVELVDGEYRGLALHRAARILDAGHGSQILCSEATAALLRHDVGAQTGLVELGVYRLRGVEAPVRLFQVEYPGIAVREAPPLRADPEHRGSVPLQFDRFFGREQELSDLQELLAPVAAAAGPSTPKRKSQLRPRLITLTGPGGTGKTRLAIEGAGQIIDAYRGAVWFVPLADLVDPKLISGAILDVLGIPRAAKTDPLDQVVEALGRQPSVLLLDNLEQLVEGGADLLRTLLDRVPSLLCLVTSRQVLALPGEREYPVPPLPTPNGPDTPERLGAFDSVRLFIDRAQAIKPDFQVTTGNAAAVAELCDRLEGIPLAIELAAARVQVLTPAQMLAQLGNRFELLITRRRGVAERHRTLRAALDWSYQLLVPEVRGFFAALSVFRGGWDVDGAEAVCHESLAIDYLAQLRECSLVITEARGDSLRFRMLEMVREYASERVGGESGPLETRHSEYFLQLSETAAPELEGPAQGRWLDRLEAEHENLRAALRRSLTHGSGEVGLRLCGALTQFWDVRGHWSEGRQMAAAALAHPETHESTSARAGALDGAANMAYRQGDYPAARRLGEEALAIQRQAADSRGEATSLNRLGLIAHETGNPEAARALLTEALALNRKCGCGPETARSLNTLASMAHGRGDHEQSHALYEEALTLNRESGNRRGMAGNLNNLGNPAHARGDFGKAQALYEEALALNRELGNRPWMAINLHNLGNVAKAQGDYRKAQALGEEALGQNRELGNRTGEAFDLILLGNLAEEQGDYARAQSLYEEALAIHLALGNRAWTAGDLHHLGTIARTQGDYERAQARFEEALLLNQELGSRAAEADNLNGLGVLAKYREDYPAAHALLEQALVLDRDLGRQAHEASDLRELGDLAARRGDSENARTLLGRALRLYQSLGMRRGCGDCLAGLASLVATGEPECAASLAGAAGVLRVASGAVPPPQIRDQEARALSATRKALGEAAFAEHLRAGSDLKLDEAINLALRSGEAS